MPTTLYEDIRGALQTAAGNVAGFPPADQRSYEGKIFSSTTGTPYARLKLVPVSGRMFSVSGARKTHVGLFLIDLFGLPQIGSGGNEALADAVKAAFAPPLILPITGGTEAVHIESADRKAAMPDGQWYMIPITINWRCFSARN